MFVGPHHFRSTPFQRKSHSPFLIPRFEIQQVYNPDMEQNNHFFFHGKRNNGRCIYNPDPEQLITGVYTTFINEEINITMHIFN